MAADYDTLVPSTWSQLAPALLLTGVAVAIVGLVPRFTHVAWAPVALRAGTQRAAVADRPLAFRVRRHPQRWFLDAAPAHGSRSDRPHRPRLVGVATPGDPLVSEA